MLTQFVCQFLIEALIKSLIKVNTFNTCIYIYISEQNISVFREFDHLMTSMSKQTQCRLGSGSTGVLLG